MNAADLIAERRVDENGNGALNWNTLPGVTVTLVACLKCRHMQVTGRDSFDHDCMHSACFRRLNFNPLTGTYKTQRQSNYKDFNSKGKCLHYEPKK